jgi:hypothetical protein
MGRIFPGLAAASSQYASVCRAQEVLIKGLGPCLEFTSVPVDVDLGLDVDGRR